jgi:hypothetical protein
VQLVAALVLNPSEVVTITQGALIKAYASAPTFNARCSTLSLVITAASVTPLPMSNTTSALICPSLMLFTFPKN